MAPCPDTPTTCPARLPVLTDEGEKLKLTRFLSEHTIGLMPHVASHLPASPLWSVDTSWDADMGHGVIQLNPKHPEILSRLGIPEGAPLTFEIQVAPAGGENGMIGITRSDDPEHPICIPFNADTPYDAIASQIADALAVFQSDIVARAMRALQKQKAAEAGRVRQSSDCIWCVSSPHITGRLVPDGYPTHHDGTLKDFATGWLGEGTFVIMPVLQDPDAKPVHSTTETIDGRTYMLIQALPVGTAPHTPSVDMLVRVEDIE